jgi:hypothetical protein
MKNLLQIGSGINVTQLALQLKRNPQLWNEYPLRTSDEASPHYGADDIWPRYMRPELLGVPESHIGAHESVWYPCEKLLPALRDIVFGVMGLVRGEALGGVLITRVPPGGRIQPHVDLGWHAEYYDKFAVQIESHQQQYFAFDDGAYSSAPGDIYWFKNQESHWVVNESPVDRITLIICIKLDNSLRG